MVPRHIRHRQPQTGNFLLGLLSESENNTIAAGLNNVVMDHLVDVVDRNGGTDLVFRSGSTKAIQPGSWIVNCTGYFSDDRPYEPYVSQRSRAVDSAASVHTPIDDVHGLLHDAPDAGQAQGLPLYELDAMDLRTKSNAAFPLTLFALALHNISLIAERVPSKVFSECGIDFNRWYPLPRRTLRLAQFMLTHRREREQQRRTLDTVRERFDVRCGPLDLGAGMGAEPVKQ